MKIARHAQNRLGMRLAQHHGARQSRQYRAQVKSAVETVRRFRQVEARVLALSDRVVTAADGALDVAQQHVDPARAVDLAGGAAAARLQHRVRMARISEAAEAEQAVAEHLGVRCQMPRLPVLDAVIVEAAQRFDHRIGRVFERCVGLHRDQERLLVLRAAPRLAAVALPTEVGIIDLHEAGQLAGRLARSHCLHDLVLDAPRGFVVHPEMALQLQRRHVGLGRSQQVDGQQPGAQRQLGRLEDRAAQQGRLMTTRTALVVDLPAAEKARPSAVATGRAAEAVRPACPVQGAVRFRFGAVLLHEFDHRQTLLELHEIDRHGGALGGEGVIVTRRRRKSRDGALRIRANQVDVWHSKSSKWTSTDTRDGEWGFTLVRRELPSGAAGAVRNSMFRYLAPVVGNEKKQVLSFNSKSIPMFPEDNRPYARESDHGTVIKLYEYDIKSSHALRKDGLKTPIEALVPQIALPIRMHECRPYGGKVEGSFDTNIVGLQVRLSENKAENLEDGYPATASFVVNSESMTAQIYAFKGNKAETYRTNEGIIFTINGQTHGSIPKSFFERKNVKMGRLARSLIVLIDCSRISVKAREDLFMASRDRLSNGELRKQVEEELEDIIGKHPGLKDLRERRRTEEITNRLQESKPLEDILDDIIKNSPALSHLFKFGQRLNKPHRAEIEEKSGGGTGNQGGDARFEPKLHPTYFRFHNKNYGEELVRNAEIDRRCYIKFDTDAQNDYVDRLHMRGKYRLDVIDGPLEGMVLDHNLNIHNGIANWSIKLPEDRLNIDTKLTLQCSVEDETMVEPFVNIAHITVIKHEEHELNQKKYGRLTNTSGGTRGQNGTGPEGTGGTNRTMGAKIAGGLAIPQIISVKHDDEMWKRYDFNESTACKVIEDDIGGQSAYTFYINIDNLSLCAEMKDSKRDVALLKKKFEWGNVLVGLALIHDDKHHQKAESVESCNGNDVFERIDLVTRAIAPFLIPMIDHLGALTEEDVVSAATRGDDD